MDIIMFYTRGIALVDVGHYKGVKAIYMENKEVRVILLPLCGGKVASFYHKEKDFELLWQADRYCSSFKGKQYAPLEAAFSDYDSSGFDDCFPSIERSLESYDGCEILYPDHGEIWSGSFEYFIGNHQWNYFLRLDDKRLLTSGWPCLERKEELVTLVYKSRILPYIFTKVFSLNNGSLTVKYKIHNIGQQTIDCFYTPHCLIQCQEDMVLSFPMNLKTVVNVVKSKHLGDVGQIYSFPTTFDVDKKPFDFRRVKPVEEQVFEKYYFREKPNIGLCKAYYPKKDVTFSLEYEVETFPYLGVWMSEGGYKGHYNMAFEPSNGFYDSMITARCNQAYYRLEKDETFEFSLVLSLS